MTAVASASPADAAPPLVIDLDGTLIRSDLLHESTLKLMRGGPHLVLALPLWLASGKARLKREIASRVTLDVASLPYDESVLEWIRAERRAGRRVVLCTASDAAYANEVAAHLGLFDDVIASDGRTNVSASARRRHWPSAMASAVSITPATRATTCRCGRRRARPSW